MLTAGDEAPVIRALERMRAMRAYARTAPRGSRKRGAVRAVGMTAAEIEEMYRYLAIANYEDRFVIPTTRREYAENAFDLHGSCGFSFGNRAQGASKTGLFGGKRKVIPIKGMS
jgi:nitrate reductase / nitrite oxidoreductase, beta subunit